MSKFCPECGSPNADEAVFCTNCGAHFPNSPQAAAPEQPESPSFSYDSGAVSPEAGKPVSAKRKIKTPLIIAVAAVALIAIVLAVMGFTGSFDRMSATSKAGKGDYIGALESYEKYLSRSGKDSTKALSQAALYALSAGDADKALMYARSVPEKTEESISVEGRAAVVLAKDAMKKNDWDKAFSFLDGCSYDEAEELMKEVRYHLGVELMEGEKWEDAAEQFEKTDYSDSKALLEKCEFALSVDANFLADVVTFCRGLIDADLDDEAIAAIMPDIEKYESAAFKDPALQECARAFIADMQSVLNTVSSSKRIYYKQIELCSPMGDASSQLIEINKLHPFGSKDWADISAYFRTPQYWNTASGVISQIASDMGKKASSGPYGREHQFIKVPNNTAYEVNVTFWFYCYDKSNKLYSMDEVNITLAKGRKTQVIFECNAYVCPSWGYDFYVEDFWQ